MRASVGTEVTDSARGEVILFQYRSSCSTVLAYAYPTAGPDSAP
ncbi:hypothetical protein [Actinacidiphila sp. bgisy145]